MKNGGTNKQWSAWGLREAAGVDAGGEREAARALSPSARRRRTGDGSGAREQTEIEGVPRKLLSRQAELS
jgi:hypothetical protein